MRAVSVLAILSGVLTAQAGNGAENAPWKPGATVVFSCDFTQYPPRANVKFSHEACDYSIFADQHPHLRLLRPGSRFSMQFSLPKAPRDASLEVVHLASAGEDGKAEAPISVFTNGKSVVEDWNVGKTGFTETRWSIGDKLRVGQNSIEWKAGDLRTHYWLRRVNLYVEFDEPVTMSFPVSTVEHALFWEGRFSQCSYNALATVLDAFYGVEGWNGDRDTFEKRTFVAALKKHGLGAYYGWAPWTSYMVQAGTIRWNGHLVDDLKAERFALRTAATPKAQRNEMIVRYEPGEKARLKNELLSRLAKGPVIIWTPYAAAMVRGQNAWQHVRTVDENTDAVLYSPNMTHSVVVVLENEKVKVYDNSWGWGIWVVKPETVVATTCAMTGSVRVERGDGSTLLGRGLRGIKDDEYNVVFWRE